MPTTTVDQFLKALAVVESSDDPQAWGDAGRAMGRWQVHPARLWGLMHVHKILPQIADTWDQLVARVLRAMFKEYSEPMGPLKIAMYWHVGHFVAPGDSTWDARYAARFDAALLNAQEEMP